MKPRKLLTEDDVRTLISLGIGVTSLLPFSAGVRLAIAFFGVGISATTLAPKPNGESRVEPEDGSEPAATPGDEMGLTGLANRLPGGYVVPSRRLRGPRVVLV